MCVVAFNGDLFVASSKGDRGYSVEPVALRSPKSCGPTRMSVNFFSTSKIPLLVAGYILELMADRLS